MGLFGKKEPQAQRTEKQLQADIKAGKITKKEAEKIRRVNMKITHEVDKLEAQRSMAERARKAARYNQRGK